MAKRCLTILFTAALLALFALPAQASLYYPDEPVPDLQGYVWAQDAKWHPGGGTYAGTLRYRVVEALGEPTPGFAYDYLALGRGGYAVFDFGVSFTEEAVTVETTWNRTGFLETAQIFGVGSDFDYAGLTVDSNGVFNTNLDLSDASVFTFLGNVDNQAADGTAYTMFPNEFRYLVVLDTTPGTSGDGFDLDAVGVKEAPAGSEQQNSVPVPGAAWLLASGLLAMACLRRVKVYNR